LNILPEFALLEFGRFPDGGFWRKYHLKAQDIICVIHETFPPNLFTTSVYSTPAISDASDKQPKKSVPDVLIVHEALRDVRTSKLRKKG
jgi:hypothetical protein